MLRVRRCQECLTRRGGGEGSGGGRLCATRNVSASSGGSPASPFDQAMKCPSRFAAKSWLDRTPKPFQMWNLPDDTLIRDFNRGPESFSRNVDLHRWVSRRGNAGSQSEAKSQEALPRGRFYGSNWSAPGTVFGSRCGLRGTTPVSFSASVQHKGRSLGRTIHPAKSRRPMVPARVWSIACAEQPPVLTFRGAKHPSVLSHSAPPGLEERTGP